MAESKNVHPSAMGKGEGDMLFFHYSKCSTCIKARRFLEARGIAFTEREAKKNSPGAEELRAWYEASGADIKKFFNTSGNIYKERGLKDKLSELSLEEKLQLLASEGMLLKRPILVTGKQVLLGFKEEEWEKALR